jgi:hypothetical protein
MSWTRFEELRTIVLHTKNENQGEKTPENFDISHMCSALLSVTQIA